jgi:hypothetical protein
MLGRVMRIRGQSADDHLAVILGHPQLKADWVKFIHRAARSGIEICKLISLEKGRPTFVWRLSISRAGDLMDALKAYERPAPPEIDPKALEGHEPVSHPGFDEMMTVLTVEKMPTGEEIIYGIPKGALPWKDVVEGLLASGRAIDVAKVYFVDETDSKVKHVWRIAWRAGVNLPRPEKPPRDIHQEVNVPQRSNAGENPVDVERERTRKAVETHRQRMGLVQGPDGKWRVPLDPYGRVTKVVLFDPERACYVPGIDMSKTGVITREMLETPEKKTP